MSFPLNIMPATTSVTTSVLYGVFVSAKSYYIGLRCLVKRKHAQMLASRVVGSRLPQELIDEVAKHLYTLECHVVRRKWRKNKTFHDNLLKFDIDLGKQLPPAESVAKEMTDPLVTGVDAMLFPISKPGHTHEPNKAKNVSYYMHLSCTGTKPAIAMSLPGGSAASISNSASTAPIKYTGTKGDSHAICAPSRFEHAPNASKSLSKDVLLYDPKRDMKEQERRNKTQLQTSRLLQVCDLEKPMRDWDGDAIRDYVELLNLNVVPFDDGDRLKPGFHIWQRVADL